MSEVVVSLGWVEPALVQPFLGDGVRFTAQPTDADLAAAVGVIVRGGVQADRAYLDTLPHLRVLARTGVGVDNVDVAECTRRGIPVIVTPGAGTNAVAEGAIAMALHLVKRLGPLTALVRDGQWDRRFHLPQGDLDGATIGIVGYGRIGARVAHLARAFGMAVMAWDPVMPPPADVAVADLRDVVARCDVLTLHVPLTDDTRHLVNADLLAAAKPGLVLVNCARGGVVDLNAAHAALLTGTLGGVGLDTFDPEPAVHHPLFDHPDVVLTPHVMGLSRRAMAATFAMAAAGIADVLAGRAPAAVANPEWMSHALVSPSTCNEGVPG